MSKGQRVRRESESAAGKQGIGTAQIVFGVLSVGAIVLAAMGYQTARKLDQRIAEIDTRVGQVSAKLDGALNQAQARRGPDPDKVYNVKVAGAPTKGPSSAPITIAEFSDFQ